MSQSKTKKTILALVLVIAEAMLSLILRLDKSLKAHLYPLTREKMLVCVRTYLPHYIIYVQFTDEGILLDSKPPEGMSEGDEDVLISGSTLSFIRLLATGDEELLQKLQFRGESDQIELLKDGVQNFGIQRITKDFLQNVMSFAPEQNRQNQKTIQTYQKKLSDYQMEMEKTKQQLAQKEAELLVINKTVHWHLIGNIVLAFLLFVFMFFHYIS